MIDSFGREINYARISVTDRCNLRCSYCMPSGVQQKLEHNDILSYEEILQVCSAMGELGIGKFRITGGEPLVRAGVCDFLERLGSNKNVQHLALTTNGTLLKKYSKELHKAGVQSLNISIDSLLASRYSAITNGGNLSDAIEGVRTAIDTGFPYIKINAVLSDEITKGELVALAELTKYYKIDVRFIELMPIGETSGYATKHFLSADDVIKQLGDIEAIDKPYMSSPARYYKFADSCGKLGFISPISCKFCSDCNRLRLTSDGKLKNCLHTNDELDVKPVLQNEKQLQELIKYTIMTKPKEHLLQQNAAIIRNMTKIGG